MTKCIYCNRQEANSKEDYLPACLGKFRNCELLLNKICRKCNKDIGNLDEQFCRCGPEAFFRIIKGIKGRKHHKKVNPFYRGSAGAKRIVIETKHPSKDYNIFCEIEEEGENAYPARQVIFVDTKGKYHSILINDEIKESKDLRKELETKGISESKPVEYWTAPEEEEWIDRLCRGFNIKINWSETSPYQKIGKKQFVATFTVNDKYFRAIAKIGFHYFLKQFNQFTGFEKEFKGIKDFIMNGGNIDQWVRQIEGSFVLGLKPGVTTTDKYCHLLAIDKGEEKIRVMLHFFVGLKGAPPHYYEVFIGRNPERIIYPQGIGHQFVYFDKPDQQGYWGRMNLMRSIRPELLP